jgi:hypothetical protein
VICVGLRPKLRHVSSVNFYLLLCGARCTKIVTKLEYQYATTVEPVGKTGRTTLKRNGTTAHETIELQCVQPSRRVQGRSSIINITVQVYQRQSRYLALSQPGSFPRPAFQGPGHSAHSTAHVDPSPAIACPYLKPVLDQQPPIPTKPLAEAAQPRATAANLNHDCQKEAAECYFDMAI